MISAVLSARLAGLDRIKSGFTSRFANRLPIFGASRLPRLANGRSLSGNAVSSQLDFAWRMRNSVFMPRSIPFVRSSRIALRAELARTRGERPRGRGGAEQGDERAALQRLGRLQVNHEFVFGRRLHRKVRRSFALEDAIDVA